MDSCAPINRDIGKVDRAISSDDETAVLHAVLDVALKEIDQQFNLLEVYACYIKMPDGKNPSDSFLAVHSFPIPLRPVSECRIKGQFKEVYDKKTNKEGVLLTLDEVNLLENFEAQCGFGWHSDSMAGRGFRVKLKKVNAKWEVTEVKCWLMS